MRQKRINKTINLIKVSESLLIYKSPKWILRYAQYDGVGIRHCEAIQRIAEAIQINPK